jgi:acyl carrier protein
MSPAAFLLRPARWLEAITRYRGSTSGGPNSAYELCVRRIPLEERGQFDLSHWRVAFNGAETVRQDTMEAFCNAFSPYGFRRQAFRPCYGLAEATLHVTSGQGEAMPRVHTVDRDLLGRNSVANATADTRRARTLIGCGYSGFESQVEIVNPETLEPCSAGTVGEIWVAGKHVAGGYWSRCEESSRTFQARTKRGEGPFLRTGDLGYAQDGELYVTGRIKDLIILWGTNHYPEDIEATVAQANPAMRPGSCAAFAVELDGEERLVVAQEVRRSFRECDQAALIQTIRSSVAAQHDVQVYAVVLLRPGTLPKTSSGKIQRHQCATAFLDGSWDTIASSITTESRAGEDGSPITELEQLLTDSWREVLGAERIGVNDNFFELGGSSIQAAMLANRLQERLGETISPGVFFEMPTVAGLARYLTQYHGDSVAQLLRNISNPSVPPEHASAHSGAIGETQVQQLRRVIRRLAPAHEQTHLKKNPRAVFILSPPRSGSTLFRVILGGHSRLFAPPELQLLPFQTLEERRATFANPNEFWLEGAVRAWMEALACDASEAEEVMHQAEQQRLSTKDFYLQLQSAIGDRMLVDKTPSYSLDIYALQRAERLFDDPLYIHLVRHPYDTIRSFESASLHLLTRVFLDGELDCTPHELAELAYNVCHRNILEFLQGIPSTRQHRLQFESLVQSPEHEVEVICRFLDLPFDRAMLLPYADKKTRMTDGTRESIPMIGDPKFHSHQGIDASAAHRWRVAGNGKGLGEITWDLAQALGYQRNGIVADPSKTQSNHVPDCITSLEASALLSRIHELREDQVDGLLDSLWKSQEQ